MDKNDDLLEEFERLVNEKNITLGAITAIGVVQKAKIGFYNQSDYEYEATKIDGPREILNLAGNISIMDGEPMMHAHITLADQNNNAIGGHLMEGTKVFACEYMIKTFKGRTLERNFDDSTKLDLWS